MSAGLMGLTPEQAEVANAEAACQPMLLLGDPADLALRVYRGWDIAGQPGLVLEIAEGERESGVVLTVDDCRLLLDSLREHLGEDSL